MILREKRFPEFLGSGEGFRVMGELFLRFGGRAIKSDSLGEEEARGRQEGNPGDSGVPQADRRKTPGDLGGRLGASSLWVSQTRRGGTAAMKRCEGHFVERKPSHPLSWISCDTRVAQDII